MYSAVECVALRWAWTKDSSRRTLLEPLADRYHLEGGDAPLSFSVDERSEVANIFSEYRIDLSSRHFYDRAGMLKMERARILGLNDTELGITAQEELARMRSLRLEIDEWDEDDEESAEAVQHPSVDYDNTLLALLDGVLGKQVSLQVMYYVH